MQKPTAANHGRPNLLAVSAGPTRRLNRSAAISPRNRPASQRIAQPMTMTKANSSLRNGLQPKRVVFDQSKLEQGKEQQQPHLKVDQLLKQLGCANERVLDDVVASVVSRSTTGGAIRRGSAAVRSRSVPPPAANRKNGDMLLESFNSVAFRQQIQKARQGSAAATNGRNGHLAPLKGRVEKPRSPRQPHHHKTTTVGPCKCKSCQTKRQEPQRVPSTANKPATPASNVTKTASPKILPGAKQSPTSTAKPVPPPRRLLQKSASASGKLLVEPAGKKENPKEVEDTLSETSKKPFGFFQSLFKSNSEDGQKPTIVEKTPASSRSDQTRGSRTGQTSSRSDQKTPSGRPVERIGGGPKPLDSPNQRRALEKPIAAAAKSQPRIEKPTATQNGKPEAKSAEKLAQAPIVDKPSTKSTSNPPPTQPEKPSSATFEHQRLSTISEEHPSTDPMRRRHSENLSGSLTLIDIGQAGGDNESVLSYPFPRPRTGSTCCQSFQFAEVMTVGGKPDGDSEPFAMFDVIVGGEGNFIQLKDDTVKNRKVWCGLTMAGEMIAVKQAEVSSLDLQKAQKEYEKIQQEVDLLKSLSHKNIVGYLGTSLEDKIVSIFMQFIPGGSLTSVLKKFGALAEPVVACYTRQILEGVEYLHSKNVVHRDIKGNNVMLMPNAVIKLIDFGCAKRAINLTKSSEEILKSMKGTPYWMAPEVMNETGHGKKSDIWSVGCTVYEMATARPPWSHLNRYAALFTISNGAAAQPQMPEKFSDEAKRFVAACMIRDPDKRPDIATLLADPFIRQHCQQNEKRILDSRGVPLNSTKRQ